MNDKFEAIIRALISKTGEQGPLTGLDIEEQFRPAETTPESVIRNLNAAFLISLSGRSHPLYARAGEFLKGQEKDPDSRNAAGFYEDGLTLVPDEINKRCAGDSGFRNTSQDGRT